MRAIIEEITQEVNIKTPTLLPEGVLMWNGEQEV
jgi:hypothetical protein